MQHIPVYPVGMLFIFYTRRLNIDAATTGLFLVRFYTSPAVIKMIVKKKKEYRFLAMSFSKII